MATERGRSSLQVNTQFTPLITYVYVYLVHIERQKPIFQLLKAVVA